MADIEDDTQDRPHVKGHVYKAGFPAGEEGADVEDHTVTGHLVDTDDEAADVEGHVRKRHQADADDNDDAAGHCVRGG